MTNRNIKYKENKKSIAESSAKNNDLFFKTYFGKILINRNLLKITTYKQ